MAQERADSVFANQIEEQFGVKFSDNNRLVIFKSGTEKFNDLFKAVSQAKRSIHMEYFNFRNDSISALLFDSLAAKAAQGVDVRILFDDFGNRSNNQPIKKKMLREIASRGISIKRYDPIRFPFVNHIFNRDHRKIVVIDGLIAYTGGMNVADYYLVGKPELGAWRDFHVRLEGEVVNELQKIFLTIWNRANDSDVHGAEFYTGYKDAADYFKALAPDTTSTAGDKKLAIVSRGPHEYRRTFHDTFLHGIRSANTEITLMNPYFTLCRHVRKEFKRAMKRGVKLRILVSAKSDIPLTPRVVEHNVHRLMKKGADVWFYEDGFQHGKVMMVDSLYTFMGSANLDSRSLWQDFECNVVICDKPTTRIFLDYFQHDIDTAAWKLTPDTWKSRFSRKRRFGAWFWQFMWPLL